MLAMELPPVPEVPLPELPTAFLEIACLPETIFTTDTFINGQPCPPDPIHRGLLEAKPVKLRSANSRAEPVKSQPDAPGAEPVQLRPSNPGTEPIKSWPDAPEAEPIKSRPTTSNTEPVKSQPDAPGAEPVKSRPANARPSPSHRGWPPIL